MLADQPPTPDIVYMMTALIAAVKTAQFPLNEFEGVKTPRYEYSIYHSLVIARSIYKRVQDRG